MAAVGGVSSPWANLIAQAPQSFEALPGASYAGLQQSGSGFPLMSVNRPRFEDAMAAQSAQSSGGRE